MTREPGGSGGPPLFPPADPPVRSAFTERAFNEIGRLVFVAVLLSFVLDCTAGSVSRRTRLGLPILPLVAASNPGRLVPNDYSHNKASFDVVKMPEAWWYMAAFGGKYVSKTAAKPILYPTVLVADDGFFAHADSTLDASRFKGFGIYEDSAGKGSGTSVHGQHGTGVLSVVGAIKNNARLTAGVAGLWTAAASSRPVTVDKYGLVESERARATADARWSFGSKFVVASITGGLAANAPNPRAAAKALNYWLKQDADLKVVNLSQDYLNQSATEELKKAFGEAEKRGVTIVIGAGNVGEIRDTRGVDGWLNGFSNIIIVGALNGEGTAYLKWQSVDGPRSSSRGDAVDVFAPGSLFMVEKKLQSKPRPNLGTSFAAPVVSGVVAMMYALNPGLSPRMVRRILMATARDLDLEGDTVFLLDAYRALFVADNLAHPVYAPFRNR